MLIIDKNIYYPSRCKRKEYPEKLPRASIIICFFNEHFKTLLRTVHSVLNRTPKHLLEEIILVDDMSDLENLHEEIEEYIQKNSLDKVKFIKVKRREGLIRARLFGARKAQGKVKIFIIYFLASSLSLHPYYMDIVLISFYDIYMFHHFCLLFC